MDEPSGGDGKTGSSPASSQNSTGPSIRVPGEKQWQSIRESDGRAWGVFESVGLASYRSENLVVLLGLGTSLGLNGSGGKAPTMSDLLVSVKTLDGYDRAAELAPTAIEAGDVEALLSACQMHVGLTDDEVTKRFLDAAEAVVLEACSFVDDTTDLGTHEAFLRKVGRRATRLARTKVFTTNYDLAIERAAQATRYTLLDGFGPTAGGLFDGGNFDLDVVRRAPDGTLQLAPNVIQLYKLHGSVDWDETNDGVRRDPSPGNPVLIYPSSMKYQLICFASSPEGTNGGERHSIVPREYPTLVMDGALRSAHAISGGAS